MRGLYYPAIPVNKRLAQEAGPLLARKYMWPGASWSLSSQKKWMANFLLIFCSCVPSTGWTVH